MFVLRDRLEERILELGGGESPMVHPACRGGHDVNVDLRMCFDGEGKQTVDFIADFNEKLPIQSEEWDAVYAGYVVEHIAWPKVKSFLLEVFRVLKPGGRFVFLTANTEAQMSWIKANPEGWDGKEFFESASEVLFGSANYSGNFHCSFFTPSVIQKLLVDAGFESVMIQPHNPRSTDMLVRAAKPDVNQVIVVGKEVSPGAYVGKVSAEDMSHEIVNVTVNVPLPSLPRPAC